MPVLRPLHKPVRTFALTLLLDGKPQQTFPMSLASGRYWGVLILWALSRRPSCFLPQVTQRNMHTHIYSYTHHIKLVHGHTLTSHPHTYSPNTKHSNTLIERLTYTPIRSFRPTAGGFGGGPDVLNGRLRIHQVSAAHTFAEHTKCVCTRTPTYTLQPLHTQAC